MSRDLIHDSIIFAFSFLHKCSINFLSGSPFVKIKSKGVLKMNALISFDELLGKLSSSKTAFKISLFSTSSSVS